MADERSLTEAMNDGSFPAADSDRELHPEKDKDLKPDSGASQVSQAKSKAASEKKQEGKKECPIKDPIQALKTSLIISGLIIVVAGAVFAVTKKIREK